LTFELVKIEKHFSQYTKNYITFTQKLSSSTQKYRFVIRDLVKNYSRSGSRTQGQKVTGSRIRNTSTFHFLGGEKVQSIVLNRTWAA